MQKCTQSLTRDLIQPDEIIFYDISVHLQSTSVRFEDFASRVGASRNSTYLAPVYSFCPYLVSIIVSRLKPLRAYFFISCSSESSILLVLRSLKAAPLITINQQTLLLSVEPSWVIFYLTLYLAAAVTATGTFPLWLGHSLCPLQFILDWKSFFASSSLKILERDSLPHTNDVMTTSESQALIFRFHCLTPAELAIPSFSGKSPHHPG